MTDYTTPVAEAVANYRENGDFAPIHTAYRAIPASARGPVQTAILMANVDIMADLLDILNNLPTTAASRTKRPDLSTADVEKVRHYATTVVVFGPEAPTDIVDHLLADYGDVVSAAVEKVATAVAKVSIGTLSRTAVAGSLSDLLADGRLTAGQVVTLGDKGVATITADGKVDVNGTTVGSLSAAGRILTGNSTNGWAAFTTADGVTVGSLRTA